MTDQLPTPSIRVDAFGDVIPTDRRPFVMGDFYTADQMRAYAQEAARQERETGGLSSHEAFWLQNRGKILAAIEVAGFTLMSNQNGFFLWKGADSPSPSTPAQRDGP